MKKEIVIICFLLIGISLVAQKKSNSDTLIRVTGEVLTVNVTTVTPSYVSFVHPENNEVYRIERKDVQKIIYRSGKIEELNPPIFEEISTTSWEAVWITENKKDVANMFVRGKISAKSSPSDRSPKAAKNNTAIKLRKKAANLGATVILLTHKEKTGAYGQFPGYVMKGVAYGTEPLPEEE